MFSENIIIYAIQPNAKNFNVFLLTRQFCELRHQTARALNYAVSKKIYKNTHFDANVS